MALICGKKEWKNNLKWDKEKDILKLIKMLTLTVSEANEIM